MPIANLKPSTTIASSTTSIVPDKDTGIELLPER
jgi:hypothetical protein